MNNRRQKIIRAVAGALAALMVISALIGALSFFVSADDVDTTDDKDIPGALVSITKGIRNNKNVTMTFTFTADNVITSDGVSIELTDYDFFIFDGWWEKIGKTQATLTQIRSDISATTDPKGVYRLELSDIQYSSVETHPSLSIRIIHNFGYWDVTVDIPTSSFATSDSSNSSDDKDDETSAAYTSKIMVENAIALDSKGNRIDEVTKDTPSFTLEVVYADIGLRGASSSELKSVDTTAFFTSGGSFEAVSSTRGTVEFVSSGTDYPRFRAVFRNVKYTGVGKDLSFQIFYVFDTRDDAVAGEGKATLYSAKADSKEDEEDEDDKKMDMSAPKIIISSYSYGDEAIIAGSEFNLDFTISNTSVELPVENIVVTLTPEASQTGPGLIVAASSNTLHIPGIDPGGSRSFSVAFQARPDAEVTSHSIIVSSTYEYVDTNLNVRKVPAALSESIAIPVSQIDRFSVDPIADTVYGMPGEEAYLTVNFINRGKSVTSNIYASIQCDNPAISSAGQPYGNLDPGKADSLDLYITASEPGTYEGEVVVQYEDENQNIKELTTPFSMFVETPWQPPPPEIPPEMNLEPPPPSGPGALSIVLCAIGGLAIAAPIALYFMKRVKAKGNEDFDEIY